MSQKELVEVHGNDGASHSSAAKNYIKRKYPNSTVSNVKNSGHRCDHGYIVWCVDFTMVTEMDASAR